MLGNMKKRGALLLFLALFSFILTQIAYSVYEESVYSGTVKDKEILKVSDRDFQFRIDSASSKVVVDIDSSGMIIENGECRIKDNFDVCVKNISFSHKNLTTYLDVYQADVEIYLIKSNVDVTHTIDKSSILIDEEATAEFSVENTADIVAKDFTATIHIPGSILVTGTDGCEKSFGSIVFKGNVHPKQIKKCTYKVKGVSGDEFELTADASYFDGVETVSTDSAPVSVKVYNHSLKISLELNKSKFDIDESYNLTINAENTNDQYELAVTTFNIKIPDGILIIKQPKDAVKNNQVLSWSGSLSPKEKKSFVAELWARRTGNYTISTEASYKISKFLISTEHKSAIEVSCDCPYISEELFPKEYSPGQKILFRAFIINPDNSRPFNNLKLSYVTSIPELQDFSTTYPKINPKESIKIFDSSFDAPELGKAYHFNISAAYESENNEAFFEKETVVIKVPEKVASKSEDKQEQVKEEVLEEAIAEAENETEEIEQQETEEDIPVITLENEKESPIKIYIIATVISAIMFVVVVLAVFKRKSSGGKVPEPVKKIETAMPKNRRNIREMLQLDLLKKENAQMMRNKPEIKWEDESYRNLKRQIDRLGIQPEGQKPKGDFWFFRKK